MGLSLPQDPSSSARTQLSVSIGAIGDISGQTGTANCVATASNAQGSVSYAWSGEKPDGSAVTFADAAAASTTITLSASDTPGNYAITVTATDSSQTAGSTAYFRVGGDLKTGGIRAILISVSGGVLGWKEQVLIGPCWVDISAHSALTTETDASVTFSETTMTIPSGIASSTAPASDADQRYFAFTSASAALQALIAEGNQWVMTLEETSMDTVTNARWGASLAFPSGTFDAASENGISIRHGYTGTAWEVETAASNASYGSLGTNATTGRRKLSAQLGTATTGGTYWPVASAEGTFTPTATIPTRIYVSCGAKTSATGANCAVSAPLVRFAVLPVSL